MGSLSCKWCGSYNLPRTPSQQSIPGAMLVYRTFKLVVGYSKHYSAGLSFLTGDSLASLETLGFPSVQSKVLARTQEAPSEHWLSVFHQV